MFDPWTLPCLSVRVLILNKKILQKPKSNDQEIEIGREYPHRIFRRTGRQYVPCQRRFRITFAQQDEGDALRPSVRLLIPANQLSTILQGISGAAKDIGEQVQARINADEGDAVEADKPAAKAKAKRK